ncbi:MAG: aminoglycoside N(3)-acetyltransferase [Chthoniobacterales bacterium]
MQNVPDIPPPLLAVPSAIADDDLFTPTRLLLALKEAGVREGGLLCVHSWLDGLGFVVGGARTVIDCLETGVGPGGTLMMPAFSGDISDPAEWQYPAIPADRIEEVRREMPPFDASLTPTRKMGMIAELFRHRPGVVRSLHPQSSFCARGPLASKICAQHPPQFRFSEDSPLGALLRHDGHVLLAGAPWNTASVLYLTEFHMPDRQIIRKKVPVVADGGGVEWRDFDELEYRDVWHEAVTHLVSVGIAQRTRIGRGDFVFFSAREAVEEVLKWRLRAGNFLTDT